MSQRKDTGLNTNPWPKLVDHYKDTFAEIFKLYVPATNRRKKYARRLFEHAISYLSSKGVKEVAIEAVGDSHLFWNKIIPDYKYNSIDDNKVILQVSNG